MEDKYLELKAELENYISSILESVEELKKESADLAKENDVVSANVSIANSYECMEREFEIAKNHLSVIELLSVVEELKQILNNH